MSAPMGVSTQRVTSKSSSKSRQTVNAAPKPFVSTKIKTSLPLVSMERSGPKSPLTPLAPEGIQGGPESPGTGPEKVSKYKRKISTNSRIKGLQIKEDQTKRDMYLVFVNSALKAKTEGNVTQYNELVSQFSAVAPMATSTSTSSEQKPTSSSQLRHWLSALSHVVSQLDKRYITLVEAIVYTPWTTFSDENLVKIYINFIGVLVSARTEYLSLVAGSTINRLTHRSSFNAPAPSSPGSLKPLTLRVVFERTQLLLRTLLSLFPTLPSVLRPHLLRYFPHKRNSVAAHSVYVRNLLDLTMWCPQLVEPILSLIIERAIAIDVEIQVELEELEDQLASGTSAKGKEKGQDTGLLENFDPFDTLAGQESDSDSSDGEEDDISDISTDIEGSEGGVDLGEDKEVDENAEVRAKRVKGMVSKLDSIMKLLFTWFEKTDTMIGSIEGGEQSLSRVENEPHPYFIHLLSIFDHTILTTFKSKYTQFLLFLAVSLPSFSTARHIEDKQDPEPDSTSRQLVSERANPHSDIFLGKLLHNALMPQAPAIPTLTRIASASYLGSFVSRALCIGRIECRRVVAVCCQWLEEKLGDLQLIVNGSSQGDTDTDLLSDISVFYAICQAIFLVFCFRWRDLLGVNDDDEHPEDNESGDEDADERSSKKWMNELSIVQRLIISPLNPLKVCSPNVVHQFARVSEKLGFVYCQSIIESNRRSSNSRMSSIMLSPVLANGSNEDGSYFGGAKSPVQAGYSISISDIIQITTNGFSELYSFFPFDPYRLPSSSKCLDGMYREWGMVAIEEDDDDEEAGEGEGEGEGEEGEEEDVEEGDNVEHNDVHKLLHAQEDGAGNQDGSSNSEDEDGDSTDSDSEAKFGMPMELGSVRDQDQDRDGLNVSVSFGKMSISPDHRQGFVGRAN